MATSDDDDDDALPPGVAPPPSRRAALAAVLATGAITTLGARALVDQGRAVTAATPRMSVVFLPHGGGPWPWLAPSFFSVEEQRALTDYLVGVPRALAARPRALLVISAHWEAVVPTVMTGARPPILYDYSGFPPETYQIPWPAPGAPALAARAQSLLETAGFSTAVDPMRGFDHGTFVPLKLAFPDADVPTIQLSLDASLDPARHLAIGRALAPLRDEGVLIIGSGMSFHNMRALMGRGRGGPAGDATAFDAWLRQVVAAEPADRDAALTRWAAAPMARFAHPREEHLLPLMVVAGAAMTDLGRVAFTHTFAGFPITAAHFG